MGAFEDVVGFLLDSSKLLTSSFMLEAARKRSSLADTREAEEEEGRKQLTMDQNWTIFLLFHPGYCLGVNSKVQRQMELACKCRCVYAFLFAD